MSYNSIEALQAHLSNTYFRRTSDAKKASGRALGTFVELIVYYLLKQWGLQKHLAIETRLPEYGAPHLTHNVEFTLHKSVWNSLPIQHDFTASLSSSAIVKVNKLAEMVNFKKASPKTLISSTSPKVIKNGLLNRKGETRGIRRKINFFLAKNCHAGRHAWRSIF